MRTSPDGRPAGAAPATEPLSLGSAAAELYGDLRLTPLLRSLLAQSGRLLGVVAGSVSLVDIGRSRYTKVAERGASCRLGQTFPLDEGITGQVADRRGPVVLTRYSDLRAGHLPETHRARAGAAAAVPIWWRGDVIGAHVAFAGRERTFTTGEIDQFETLSQVGAAGIVTAGAAEPSLAHLLRDRSADPARPRWSSLVVTAAGSPRPTGPRVARAAVEVVGRASHDASRRDPASPLRIALIYRSDRLRLLVHDRTTVGGDLASLPSGPGPTAWRDLVSAAGGAVSVEQVPGWGSLVRVDLPYESGPDRPSPLTSREHEVLALLAEGLSDRQVAQALVVARKTVEKHVGAVLRKTGTASRTAAVVRALEQGWLPAPGRPWAR
jgi:DNA-binding CsgD family transcriptional regulator